MQPNGNNNLGLRKKQINRGLFLHLRLKTMLVAVKLITKFLIQKKSQLTFYKTENYEAKPVTNLQSKNLHPTFLDDPSDTEARDCLPH